MKFSVVRLSRDTERSEDVTRSQAMNRDPQPRCNQIQKTPRGEGATPTYLAASAAGAVRETVSGTREPAGFSPALIRQSPK